MQGQQSNLNIPSLVWTNIRNKLEPAVVHAQDVRLYGIKCNLRIDRLNMLLPAYNTWIASLGLSTAEEMVYPVLRELAVYPVVARVLDAEPDVQVTEASFRPAIPQFADIVASFLADKKNMLRDMIPPENVSVETGDPLELATSIFEAPAHTVPEIPGRYAGTQYVTGWKMHSILHGYDWDAEGEELGYDVPIPSFGTFDPRLSAVAAFLVALCGGNRFTTTVEDMDRMDRRFGCRECMDSQVKRRLGYHVNLNGRIPPTRIMVDAMTWRAAVCSYSLHLP
jgi:hypothetical protein